MVQNGAPINTGYSTQSRQEDVSIKIFDQIKILIVGLRQYAIKFLSLTSRMLVTINLVMASLVPMVKKTVE